MQNTITLDCRTGYVAQKAVRVSKNVGKVEDSSSVIRFVVFAMIATTVAFIGFKVMAMAGV